MIEERLMRVGEVAALLSISERQVWRKAQDKAFPKPIKLSPKVTRWRFSEIHAVMRSEWAGGKTQ